MIRNGKRTVWSDVAARGIDVRTDLAQRMGPWAATLAECEDVEVAEDESTARMGAGGTLALRALLTLGAEWDDSLRRTTSLWDAQREADRRADPLTVAHVSTVYGRAAGAPMVDPSHALLRVERRPLEGDAPHERASRGLEPIRPARRGSRMVELADAAYGMGPAARDNDVPF